MKPRRIAKFNSGENQRSHKASKKITRSEQHDNESFKRASHQGKSSSKGSKHPQKHLKEISAQPDSSAPSQVSSGNGSQVDPAMLQFIPMNRSNATFRPPVIPSKDQMREQERKTKLDGAQEPEIRFPRGGQPHFISDKKIPSFVKLMPKQPLEIAVVKHFNASEEKLFGFATTQFPNESGKPDLFFHIGGGCRLWLNQNYDEKDQARNYMAEMVLLDRHAKPLPLPRQGDEICVIRGKGVKGEKIAMWCYHRDYEALVSEFVAPPRIRLVCKTVGFGGRSSNTKTAWEGNSIPDLRNAFPHWKVQEGTKSTTGGTVSHYFEQLNESGEWERIEDPR